jgi:hypothetical protein
MDQGYVIYIDEAGDDGFGKLEAGGTGQSTWFAVGACVVRAENDPKLVTWRDEIAGAFANRQRRDLHFRDLKHEQRRHACRVLSTKPIRAAAVLSNKRTLLTLPADRLATFKRKNHLHNYLSRYLLERVSTSIKSHASRTAGSDCRAKVVFSRRGGMSYEEFRNYLR